MPSLLRRTAFRFPRAEAGFPLKPAPSNQKALQLTGPSIGMKRHRGAAAVGVTVLAVGSALANLCEPHSFQNPGDLSRLEDRNVTDC